MPSVGAPQGDRAGWRAHRPLDPATQQPQSPGNGVATGRQFLKAALTASRKHFQWEERLLFPLIDKTLKPETLAELGQACIDRTATAA